jgi:uncharacterized protein
MLLGGRATLHISHMIQRATERKGIAQDVADRIAEAVRPWRVVLFGSRARGDARRDSDYDFYVEVEPANDDTLRDARDRLSQLRDGVRKLDFHVCRRGDLERRRDDPGTIEWDVAREGIVLYADSVATTHIAPTTDRVREGAPGSLDSLMEWMEAAERDLRGRRDLEDSGNEHSELICWLSQQAAEKYMKALLVSRNLSPVRTHELTLLLAALRAAGMALKGLDADCALLEEHAVSTRYPRRRQLHVDDARLTSAAADRVVSAMRELLPPRLQ